MATTLIALLRGINVGKAKRISMADLRALVSDLGYGNVRTLLNSGNVVFTSKSASTGAVATRIEKALVAKLGVAARVVVITEGELVTAVAENPLVDRADNPSRMMVAVFDTIETGARVKALLKEDWKPGALALGQRVAYYWCPDGILESKLASAVARAHKDSATARNWATMLKLRAMLDEV